jgi:predicted Zn-dependent protease with MMP-like domain
VDIETRRKKQQDLMIRMVERKVRERAQQLYEERGQIEGRALADWVQAETEILDDSIVAPLYRRAKATAHNSAEEESKDSALVHDPQPVH